MAFNEVPYENIANESDYSKLEKNPKQGSSLNPKTNLGFQEIEEVVYYKNPKIQFLVVLICGIPIVWFLLAAFSPPKQVNKEPEPATDTELARTQQELDKERDKNHDLTVQNAIDEEQNQESQITTFDAEAETAEPIKKETQPVQPAPVQQQSPVVSRQKPEPVVQEVAEVTPIEPEIDPMQKWLEVSNRGHYVTSAIASPDNSSSFLVSDPVVEQNEREYPLYTDASIAKRFDSPSAKLYSTEQLKEERESRLTNDEVKPIEISQNSPEVKNKRAITFDVGESVEAVLESSVVWSTQGNGEDDNKKYLLQLKEGWEDMSGEEIFPEGTRIIARVTQRSSSGLFSMEAIEIMTGERKITVPTGAIQIEGKNGSPLKAELKQKDDSSFARDLGRVVAPGVGRAFNSAETLILNDGNSSSIVRSRSNPVTNGISGVADGAGDVLNSRLNRNNLNSSVSDYFQLEEGEKVRLMVYDNFSI